MRARDIQAYSRNVDEDAALPGTRRYPPSFSTSSPESSGPIISDLMVAYTASGSYILARTRTGYHKGSDEACNIQIGSPVKIKLVVNELVG